MNDLLLLVLMALAVARLTRVVVKDTFPPALWLRDRLAGGWRELTPAEHTELQQYRAATSLRAKPFPYTLNDDNTVDQRYVHRWKRSPHWLGELVSCPWCASGYIAGAVTAGVDVTTSLALPVLWGLATWAVGAWLAAQEWS